MLEQPAISDFALWVSSREHGGRGLANLVQRRSLCWGRQTAGLSPAGDKRGVDLAGDPQR
jgi:hypothetical protein